MFSEGLTHLKWHPYQQSTSHSHIQEGGGPQNPSHICMQHPRNMQELTTTISPHHHLFRARSLGRHRFTEASAIRCPTNILLCPVKDHLGQKCAKSDFKRQRNRRFLKLVEFYLFVLMDNRQVLYFHAAFACDATDWKIQIKMQWNPHTLETAPPNAKGKLLRGSCCIYILKKLHCFV